MLCNKEDLFYIAKVSKSSTAASSPTKKYRLSNYPDELQKKVILLKHFKSYLEEQERKDGKKPSSTSDGDNADSGHVITYVKKWVRTRHAIFFRLNNKTVQVAFFDSTEIVLSSEAKLVTYVDKLHNRETFNLSTILKAHRNDVAKRLKYTKDILHQLITGCK